MRRLIDRNNAKLRRVLEALLSKDIDITFREVARRHRVLSDNPSVFTRNDSRKDLIKEFQKRQTDARHVKTPPTDGRSETVRKKRKDRSQDLEVCKKHIEALVSSHAACVAAVFAHGSYAALERFWSKYKSIGDTVRELEAIPPEVDARVIRFSRNRGDSAAKCPSPNRTVGGRI